MNPAVADVISRGNPCVFFDIAIGGANIGRIKIELFADGITNIFIIQYIL